MFLAIKRIYYTHVRSILGALLFKYDVAKDG